MKIKILLMPFAIALAIGLSVWLIWPLYTNGLDGIKELSAKFKKETEKFSQLEVKIGNADRLSAALSADPQKSILYGFIPEENKEEEIIDSINCIASSSGLSVSDLDVEVKKETESETELAMESESAEEPAVPEDGLLPPAAAPAPKGREINISAKMVGTYDSVKKFLVELYKLERHSDTVKITIKPHSSSGEGQAAPSGILDLEAEIVFNVLPAVKISGANANDPIFLSGNLNTGIFSKIKEAKSRAVAKLEITQKGKSNLFIP